MSFTNCLLFHLSIKISTSFARSVYFEALKKTTFAINRQLRLHFKQQKNEMLKFGKSKFGADSF